MPLPFRPLIAPLTFALSAVMAQPGLAESFSLARLTEHVDVALGAGRDPTGELVARAALGDVDLDLRHVEFMGGMGGLNLYVRPQNNPLVRSSLARSRAAVDLGTEAAMPLSISFGLDEWEAGNRNLRLIAHSGLRLSALQFDHRVTLTTRSAADGMRTQSSAGRLALGFNLLGGRQEGVVAYDAAPLAQVSHLHMNSRWRFGGGAAEVGFTHRPRTALTEARLGFRRPVGAGFQLTSDIMADSAGGYTLGLRVALPFGPKPKRESWSLSALVADLRAARAAPAIVESDAYAFEEIN